MIRRLRRKKAPLTIDEYVHRATLGLPRAERLDAATELRAHLLERVAEYQAQGYAREEAEFLAVRGMGEVQVTNRELLGHFFTHRAGWLTLFALLAGSGAWAAYRASQWEGVRPAAPIAQDDTAVLQLMAGVWPIHAESIFRQAAEVRFPKGTRSVFGAMLTSGAKGMNPAWSWPVPSGLTEFGTLGQGWRPSVADQLKFWQGRFRLLSTAAPDFTIKGERCKKGQFAVGNLLYGLNTYQPKIKGLMWKSAGAVTYTSDLASGFCFPNDSNTVQMHASSLSLNTWTLITDLPAGPPGQGTLALLLYPSSGSITQDPPAPERAYRYDAAQRQWLRR